MENLADSKIRYNNLVDDFTVPQLQQDELRDCNLETRERQVYLMQPMNDVCWTKYHNVNIPNLKSIFCTLWTGQSWLLINATKAEIITTRVAALKGTNIE